ncbi:GDCCVxC domain-containing (seleno)protein [Sphingomonas sp.]|uniref:GDCCVxC domain-containing (seleno)protein n=1 Tax=Sphingomonas sp. TaxID=28214 RepID=UPI003457C73A
MELQSTLTCPNCGHVETETMPTNACQFFYDCRGCAVVLRPNTGDCCVFCSFGTVPCPPIQESRATGTAACCQVDASP